MAERNPGWIDAGCWPDWAPRHLARRCPGAPPPSADPSRLTPARPGPTPTRPGKPDGLSLAGLPPALPAAASRSSGRIELDASPTSFRSRPCSTGAGWMAFKPSSRSSALTPLAAGSRQDLRMPLRQAGTFLCDLRLLGDGQARPAQATALIVGESDTVPVDRDEIVLIEDWRLQPDGTAIAPGPRRRGYRRRPDHQRRDIAGFHSPKQRAHTAPLRQWLPTRCPRGENGAPGRPRHGDRQPAGRTVPGAQRRAGAGTRRPGRRLCRCHRPARLPARDTAA